MTVKPTYEELEKRVGQLEKIESERNQGEDIVQDGQSMAGRECERIDPIEKENTVLFPMADAQLVNKDTELFEAFERLERERIGAGKHDEFHALLDQLQSTYLK